MKLNKVIATAAIGTIIAVSALLPSAIGVDFIAKHEGVSNAAYLDPVGIVTICYGSTTDVQLGDVASNEDCKEKLRVDLSTVVNGIRRHVKHGLTQGQFDALVSFTYNCGVENLRTSTLLKKINSGDCVGAASEFNRWTKAKGRTLKGLVTRRKQESDKFLEGCSAW